MSGPPGISSAASGVREPDYDADMKLAEGVTCDDCSHASRCFAFGFSKPGRTSCDFWPNRYRSALTGLAAADTTEPQVSPGRTT